MRVSALILAILLLATQAQALNISLDADEYAHAAWTLRAGAFRGTPRAFAQTADGYLWLATAFGLLRFDGIRFTAWHPANAAAPQDVVGLLAGSDGSLWIGTASGLGRIRGTSLTMMPQLSGSYVTALFEDRAHTVWVGTSGGFDDAARLCAIRGDAVECPADARFGRFVSRIYEGTDGALWVAAAKGLWRWRPGPPRLFPVPEAMAEIHAIAEADGDVVVAVNRDVLRLTQGRFERLLSRELAMKPTALLRDRDGGLWIGTQDRGVLHVHAGRVDTFSRVDGLSANFVSEVFEDREGNIWVATLNGVDQFHDVVVATLSSRQGLAADSVVSVLATSDGSVWIGTLGGLDRWGRGAIASVGGLPWASEAGVGSLFQDSGGRLWLSSPRGLAYVRNGRTTLLPGVRSEYVQAFAEDASGTVWVSDQDRGLLRFRDGRLEGLVPWATVGNRVARSLAADPRGGLWLGFFQGGIAYIDGSGTREYTTGDGLGAGAVTNLHLDHAGTLWVATQRGVSRVRDGNVATLSSRNGLPCDIVHWVMEDSLHALWMLTACGLVRLSQADLEAWVLRPDAQVHTTVYDEAHGVSSRAEAGSYSPKVTLAADGRLWFATYDGASVIDPRHIPFNSVVPPVRIEAIVADGESYGVEPKPRLPPLVHDVRIDYTALSLVAPEKVRFRYRLEGRDRDWVDAGTRRQAFYTDLPPGSYRFRVAAANNDGVWSDTAGVLDFGVAPAIYQRAWARAAITLVTAFALWGVYRLRLWRMAAELHTRFEERLAERTRIAQELHDTLLQGFISTSMQLHAVADTVTDSDTRGQLLRMLDRVRNVIDEGRLTVQGLRSSAAVDDLEQALACAADDLRGPQQVEMRIVVEGKRRPLHPLIRDDVYRIAREALANVFAHAGATRVEVELEYGTTQLRLKVRDNGRGIDDRILSTGRLGHWGLPGMRERAKHLGTLTVWSRVNAGTEIELVVPAHVAFPLATPPGRWSRVVGLRADGVFAWWRARLRQVRRTLQFRKRGEGVPLGSETGPPT